jgi:hypothetical protein
VGASKLCIVQFVGNKFVCITVQGLVEIGKSTSFENQIKITYPINGNDTHSPHVCALIKTSRFASESQGSNGFKFPT